MSLMKENYNMYEATHGILLEIGAICTCDAHDDFCYRTGMTEEKVYDLASEKYKEFEDSEIVPQSFQACVSKILEETIATSKDECPFCNKLLDD